MNILRLPLGIQQANCYIVTKNKKAIIIDPGSNPDLILNELNKRQLEVKKILLTHGHGDHIGGVNKLKSSLDVKVYAHEEEEELIMNPELNLSEMLGMGSISVKVDYLLKDKDILKFEDMDILVVHTPGHTKGGVCFKIGNYLFTGDTIFKESIGRTDFPTGNMDEIQTSIKRKIFSLEDDTIILSGHGMETSVGYEKKNNMFVY